jgi:ABC-type glutathione transport system ATPase component
LANNKLKLCQQKVRRHARRYTKKRIETVPIRSSFSFSPPPILSAEPQQPQIRALPLDSARTASSSVADVEIAGPAEPPQAEMDGVTETAISLPFTPIKLVCRGISYYVKDPSSGAAPGVVKDTSDREIAGKLQLLKSIDLFAEPAVLTALMGGSGAGKTTLMDVIAGRKTQGQCEHRVQF